jgi:hypothetical protein
MDIELPATIEAKLSELFGKADLATMAKVEGLVKATYAEGFNEGWKAREGTRVEPVEHLRPGPFQPW